ncbi:MAG: UPF0280 family protein [Pseudomonadota bacterium]
MSGGPQASLLPGGRLHLHHGPIDLIIGVDGSERDACFATAVARFQTVLIGLTAELPNLRRPLHADVRFDDPIARRMADAVRPHFSTFVTPMAAVAGAVADEVLSAMLRDHRPQKAYVNNGGDIALHVTGDASFCSLGPAGEITVTPQDSARGIATSGWQGRSHSLGIADAVTVLARTAAAADVAATLICNAVNLSDRPAITRVAASALNPESDLGDRPVTTHVGSLTLPEIHEALDAGRKVAAACCQRGVIESAILSLQGKTSIVTSQSRTGVSVHA